MARTTRAEVGRRVGAGVVALVGTWTAVTLPPDGTWALLGDGLGALLGEGSLSTAGEAFRVVRADGLPALTLALGLVPTVALVLAAALRPDRPAPRATRAAAGAVVAGAVLLVVGVLVATADPASLRLATRWWYWSVGSPRMLAGVWLVLVGAGVSGAGVGVLVRRRGAVVAGAALVSVGALATALSTAVWGAWTIRSLGRYRGGPTSTTVVLHDGSLGLVAGVATLVAGWCAAVAWRRLARRVPEPDVEPSPDARAARTRRRRLVAVGTAGVLVAALGLTVGTRATQREPVQDVLADPVLASCVERALGVGQGTGIAPGRLDEVGRIDCPWGGSGDRVASLAGIEQLTSVREVDLTGQDVTDLAPLAALTGLASLRLTSNAAVTDLSALDGLPLTNLGLSGTGVSDLGPLAGTTTLQWVGLAGTGVTDLRPLAGSTGLLELDVAHASVADLSPLAGATSLSRLDVRENQVADLTPLASMPALDELWVGGNPVADLRPLLDAPALLGVDVEGLDGRTPGIEELRAKGVYVGGLA